MRSTGASAFFWSAAADGSGALYGEGSSKAEDLFAFDLERHEEGEAPRRLVAHNVKGVLGASDDLSRIYFVSSDALTGAQQNSEGEVAQAGRPNLYLDEEGGLTFVATLIAGDVGEGPQALEESNAYSVVSPIPRTRASRVSAGGERVVFQSRAPLTGFDNTDAASGEPLVEVYAYEAGGDLACVSCNPSGARPSGSEKQEPFLLFGGNFETTHVFAAAWIPTWERPLYAPRALSDDGRRLFSTPTTRCCRPTPTGRWTSIGGRRPAKAPATPRAPPTSPPTAAACT